MRCITLDDPAADDPTLVGAKAAGLATARRAGLPVLPGVVVPVAESRPVVDAATRALASGQTSRARLATMQVQPDDALLAAVGEAVEAFPAPLIVRSSSPLEADGTWSGAFSSFHGIAHDELATAIRGCWGSAFAVNVLDRAEHSATPPDRLALAVLIQPELAPELGGTARLLGDGTVQITATTGPLRPLMSGEVEGLTAKVAPDGAVDAPALAGHETLVTEVAELARRVNALLDHHLIEWAAADGSVTLLQSIRSRRVDPPELVTAADPELATPIARRIARLTQRFPGPLAEELVLPWAVALDGELTLPPTTTGPADDPRAVLAAARADAAGLTVRVWGGTPRSAAERARQVLRQMRTDRPGDALATIGTLAPPGPDEVAALTGLLAALHAALVERGLASDDTFWRLGGDEVDRALTSGAAPTETRLGVDRWEPFLHNVVMACGEHHTGTPAAPGAGAGVAFVVTARGPAAAPRGRYVIVAPEPTPNLSPLLWNAAGLVTRSGSTGAHLIEFAHSIGVPTVTSCPLPALSAEDPPLLAVDGTAGTVAVLLDTQGG
jgi:hypothetical protein